MYKVKSAILFLIFNRPKETQILFDSIKIVKPKKLYVAADGPRDNGKDVIACKETKAILNQIDWDCELITLFREENLGCKRAVSEAISWFFEKEEEGIILEDDCKPCIDFFRFCDMQLERYRNDYRIGHICGCNFQDGIKRGEADYYFSKLTHVWGWASWRRVWEKYDIGMNGLELAYENKILSSLIDNTMNIKSIYHSLQRTKKGEINTWDYQYFFSNLMNGHFSIIPNYNLISNVGFNDSGTHTFDSNSPMSNVQYGQLPEEIRHPKNLYQHRIADQYTLRKELPNRFQLVINRLRKIVRDVLVILRIYKPKK